MPPWLWLLKRPPPPQAIHPEGFHQLAYGHPRAEPALAGAPGFRGGRMAFASPSVAPRQRTWPGPQASLCVLQGHFWSSSAESRPFHTLACIPCALGAPSKLCTPAAEAPLPQPQGRARSPGGGWTRLPAEGLTVTMSATELLPLNCTCGLGQWFHTYIYVLNMDHLRIIIAYYGKER